VVPLGLYGNNRLSWETSEQFNAGIDLTALQNRVSFTADFYVKTTRDLLYPSPLPSESGYDEVKVNVGSLQNRGLELMVNAFPIRKQDLTWNVSYNMGFNNDKVLELLGGVPILSSNRYLVEEGGRLGTFFGYQNLGVYPYDASNAYSDTWERLTPVNVSVDGKTAEYVLNGQPYGGKVQQLYTNGLLAKGGDVIWLNARQDSVIDDADRVTLGNAQPKFTAGFFNNISYKSFSLSFNLYSSWGGKLYNRGRRNINTFDGTNLTPEPYMVYNSWFNQGDVTDIPRISGTSAIGNMRELNSYFIEDASFIRLRNIRLTYTLSQALASRIHLKGLSAYIYGNNLLTWTDYKWYDPEINFGNPLTMGEDNGRYPRSRQIGLGLNINL
jgi:TonB-dependent starch-binding outer membrane protein SusC